MILDTNGEAPKPIELSIVGPPRVLNQITREDITFSVKAGEEWTQVVGMLNIGSAQKFREADYPDASPKQLSEEAMESICRGAASRIYGKVRADALTAREAIAQMLNRIVGIQSGDILKMRALMEPLVEAGSELSGDDGTS